MDLWGILAGNQIFAGAAGAGILLGALNYLRPIPARIWNFFIDRFTTLLAVHSGDPTTFGAVSAWMSRQNLSRWAKRFRLRDVYDSDSHQYESRCDPHYGTYWFWWKGRLCQARTWKDDAPSTGGSSNKTRDFGEVRVFGSGAHINAEFRAEVEAIRVELASNGVAVRKMPSVYEVDASCRLHAAVPPALKKHQLENIEHDIEGFLGGESWYLERGIPYRRGYLFHGPPGTGKTSLIKYLAVKFKTSIYYATASDLMGGAFAQSLTSIPQGSFVVIEDIDRIFAQAKLGKDEEDKKSLIDLAAFLNSTDGISSPHGLIFILTANDLNPIDPAVLRSGRIDQRIYLNEVDEHQANLMHVRFFQSENHIFARHAAQRKLTPAQLQECLLKARKPENVLSTLETV